MKKGKRFELIKQWMAIGARYDRAVEAGDLEKVKEIKIRMKEKQAQYDKIMEDCPMEFRNYNEDKYEWDKENVRNYYTKWDREDIFLTRASLKRCRQWEKKHNLPPFEQEDLEKQRKEQQRKDYEKDEKYALEERYKNRQMRELKYEGTIRSLQSEPFGHGCLST